MSDNEKVLAGRQVNEALDEVKELFSLRSDRQLAGLLDIEKQNVSRWRAFGEVSAKRACQIEQATQGRVTWSRLCPNLVWETKRLFNDAR